MYDIHAILIEIGPTNTETDAPSNQPSKYPSEFPSYHPSNFPSLESTSQHPTQMPSITPSQNSLQTNKSRADTNNSTTEYLIIIICILAAVIVLLIGLFCCYRIKQLRKHVMTKPQDDYYVQLTEEGVSQKRDIRKESQDSYLSVNSKGSRVDSIAMVVDTSDVIA